MKSFTKNQINSDSDLIAKELKRAREDKKVSIEEVAQRIKINKKYISALEKGDFLSLPKGLYGKSFLKEYSEFLGLSPKRLLEIFSDQEITSNEKTKNLFSNQIVKSKYFLSIPKFLKNTFILLIVLLLFLYLATSFQKLRSAPYLEISFPPENLITNDKELIIEGNSEKDTNITINGVNVLVNLDGSFSQVLNLKKGINQITIEAKKRYGQSYLIKRQILVNE